MRQRHQRASPLSPIEVHRYDLDGGRGRGGSWHACPRNGVCIAAGLKTGHLPSPSFFPARPPINRKSSAGRHCCPAPRHNGPSMTGAWHNATKQRYQGARLARQRPGTNDDRITLPHSRPPQKKRRTRYFNEQAPRKYDGLRHQKRLAGVRTGKVSVRAPFGWVW